MKTWLILGSVYIVFFFWYTDIEGALSQEEIQGFLNKHEQNIIDNRSSPNLEELQLRMDFLRRFMEEDSGRQFIMVNNIEMDPDLSLIHI